MLRQANNNNHNHNNNNNNNNNRINNKNNNNNNLACPSCTYQSSALLTRCIEETWRIAGGHNMVPSAATATNTTVMVVGVPVPQAASSTCNKCSHSCSDSATAAAMKLQRELTEG